MNQYITFAMHLVISSLDYSIELVTFCDLIIDGFSTDCNKISSNQELISTGFWTPSLFGSLDLCDLFLTYTVLAYYFMFWLMVADQQLGFFLMHRSGFCSCWAKRICITRYWQYCLRVWGEFYIVFRHSIFWFLRMKDQKKTSWD